MSIFSDSTYKRMRADLTLRVALLTAFLLEQGIGVTIVMNVISLASGVGDGFITWEAPTTLAAGAFAVRTATVIYIRSVYPRNSK